jgi:hypothetical protein
MIEIELQLQILATRLLDDAHGLAGRVEEIARHVARVDRLDHQCHAFFGQAVGGAPEIGDVDGPSLAPVLGPRPVSRHGVKAPALRRARVRQRPLERLHEFVLAPGERGHAPLALGPVARRQIEQRLGQMTPLEPGGDLVGGEIIGKEELDPGEPAIRGGREPVEKRRLLKHHAEIGGELRHCVSIFQVRRA